MNPLTSLERKRPLPATPAIRGSPYLAAAMVPSAKMAMNA